MEPYRAVVRSSIVHSLMQRSCRYSDMQSYTGACACMQLQGRGSSSRAHAPLQFFWLSRAPAVPHTPPSPIQLLSLQGPFLRSYLYFHRQHHTPTELLLPSRFAAIFCSPGPCGCAAIDSSQGQFSSFEEIVIFGMAKPGPLLTSPPSKSKSQNTQTYQVNGMPPRHPIAR